MAVIQGTLLDDGGAVYNVKAYGLAGDGVTDDTASLRAMIDEVPANATLLFPTGTYLLSTWTALALTKSLRFEASEPGVVLKGPATSNHFVSMEANLNLRGIGFERWHTVLMGAGSGAVDSVHVAGCRATSAQYFLNWTWSATPGNPEYVHRLVVEDSHFEGLTSAVLYGSMNAREIIVRNNTAINCVRYVCRFLGGQIDQAGGVQGRGRLLFQGNYVRDLTQGTFTGSAAVARVVQASADRIEVVNNFARNVSTLGNTDPQDPQGGANFAYITSPRLYVAGNLCWDVGSPGTSSAIIHEKNHDAFGTQIIGNSFIQSEDNAATADAIQLSGKSVLVDGVFATGLRGAVAATDRVEGGLISNVSAKDHRGVVGILVLGGKDIHIQSPLIRGHVNAHATGQPRGIVIQSRNDPTPAVNDVENIRISNPMIRDVSGPSANSGVGVHVWAAAGTMKGIAIHGGFITGCDRAVELSDTSNLAVIEDVEILDTDLRGNRLTILNNTNTSPAATTIIVRDSRGYRTENRGMVTMLASIAYVNVTHGLARVPELSGISVTPAGSLGNATRFWISKPTPTASYFTIHTDVAPGVLVPFAWQANSEEP